MHTALPYEIKWFSPPEVLMPPMVKVIEQFERVIIYKIDHLPLAFSTFSPKKLEKPRLS